MAQFLGLLHGERVTDQCDVATLEAARGFADKQANDLWALGNRDESDKAYAAARNLDAIILIRREEERQARIAASRAIDPR